MRYYLIYGPITLGGATAIINLAFARITDLPTTKNVSIVKSTQVPNGVNQWRTEYGNVPELHYEFPLQFTDGTVVHDAIQRAFAPDAGSITYEYFPFME